MEEKPEEPVFNHTTQAAMCTYIRMYIRTYVCTYKRTFICNDTHTYNRHLQLQLFTLILTIDEYADGAHV